MLPEHTMSTQAGPSVTAQTLTSTPRLFGTWTYWPHLPMSLRNLLFLSFDTSHPRSYGVNTPGGVASLACERGESERNIVRTSFKKRIASIATALFVGLAASVAVVAPASAATPVCQDTATGPYIYNYSIVGYRSYYSTASTTTFNCRMYQGVYNNDAVETLQRTLKYCYGESLTLDGDFGPATKAAVKRAQAYHNISQDGVAGPITLSKLKWVNSSGSCFLQSFYSLA